MATMFGRMMPVAFLLGVTGLVLASCARPPVDAYVRQGSAAGASQQVAIGKNTVGETCSMQDADNGAAEVYCGTWQQPSARLHPGAAATADQLPGLAANSAWRESIDQRYLCQPPVATSIFGDHPAELLECAQRNGGWPHVAMVAIVDGRAWYADGVLPAAVVIQRAIGVRAGILSADTVPPSSAADALLAQRLAAQSVSSGDIGAFDGLIAAGTRANLSDNPSAAEAAFRAALALQRKALGHDNPNTAGVLMTLALQLSDEGQYQEAAALFSEAEALVPRAADPILPPRLLHYRGLDALNRGDAKDALQMLQAADAAYSDLVPPSVQSPPAATRAGRGSIVTNQALLADPEAQTALVGLVEARREEAVAMRELGRVKEANALLTAAAHLAEANGIARPALAARLYRTRGFIAAQAGDQSIAIADLQTSLRDFSRALPDSKPVADTALLQAGQMARNGDTANVLPVCESAVSALVSLKSNTTPALMAPCLDAYGSTASAATGPTQQKLLASMFTAAQLAQSGITSEQIAQATARLQENARDPKVADAIRRRQDTSDALQRLYRQRDALVTGGPSAASADLDARIRKAQAAQADADAALQAASPNFGQLAQQVVSSADVFAALRPGEALVMIAVGPKNGWTLVLRDGTIAFARLDIGDAALTGLVQRLRASIELTDTLPTFDVGVASKLYQLTLAPVAAALDGVKNLVVAPSGALLSMPFEVLLTGPADPEHLADAPWLLHRFILAHVPAAANFVSLRRIAGGSRAAQPWFGFGDFVPITLAQAQHSFTGPACVESAKLLASLPQLPYAQKELAAARALLGASPADQLLGPAFTVPAVMKATLRDYRVLHFAAHALLPAELQCQSEPAIVTSDPSGAVDASQALLTASDVTQLDLDADLVILSACNSGGGGNGTAGESLSGLARAFFYAGARALMVTHWSVSDQVAAYLVADTLARMRASPALGVSGALQAAQLAMLAQAGKSLPAELAHPFFWAPFAVIGAGGASLTRASLPAAAVL
jgi:CHAT domain-containing protein